MYVSPHATPAVKRRIAVEKRIVLAVINTLLAAGYELSVNDGDEEHPFTADRKSVIKAIMETDDDFLRVRPVGKSRITGWVRFVYGNDGWDVINDYTTNLEDALKDVLKLVEKLGK